MFAELIPVYRRGFYMGLVGLFFGLGSMSVVLVSWFVVPRYGWRAMMAIAALPAFIMVTRR